MKILDALLVLKEQAVNGCVDDPRNGICHNLSLLIGNSLGVYSFVKCNCCDWEFFSGNHYVPISGYLSEPLWEGEQLELRLSLIEHLITKAKILEGF